MENFLQTPFILHGLVSVDVDLLLCIPPRILHYIAKDNNTNIGVIVPHTYEELEDSILGPQVHMSYHLVLSEALIEFGELQGPFRMSLSTVLSMSASRLGKPHESAMKTCSYGVEPSCTD